MSKRLHFVYASTLGDCVFVEANGHRPRNYAPLRRHLYPVMESVLEQVHKSNAFVKYHARRKGYYIDKASLYALYQTAIEQLKQAQFAPVPSYEELLQSAGMI